MGGHNKSSTELGVRMGGGGWIWRREGGDEDMQLGYLLPWPM